MSHNRIQFTLLLICYVELVLTLGYVIWRRRAGLLAGLDRADRWIVPAAALLGLVLRLTLPEASVLHENGHGYRYIGMAVDPASDLHVYGSGYQALFYLLYRVFPPVCSVTLLTNVILGSLTILPLGWLVARLFGRGSGAMAGLCLAVLPVHVRLCATESPFVLAILLTMLALWAMVELRRQPGWDLALLCGLAAAPAAQIRPVLVLVPMYVLLFGLLCAPGTRRFVRSRELFVLLCALALFLWGHLHWMNSMHLGTEQGSHYAGLLDLSPGAFWRGLDHGLLLDWTATPPALLVLGLLGIVAGWKINRRGALLLAGGFVFLVYVYAARSGYFTEALRFGAASQVLLAALCGPGLCWIGELAGRLSGRPSVRWVAVALVLGSALLSRSMYTTVTPEQREYRFIQSAYDRLPGDCTLVVADRFMGSGRVNAVFPDYEFLYRTSGRRVVTTSRFEHDEGCVLYFQGLACAAFEPGEVVLRLRPECQAFRQAHTLDAVVEERVTGVIAPSEHRLPRSGFTLGFYRVAVSRRSSTGGGDAGRLRSHRLGSGAGAGRGAF